MMIMCIQIAFHYIIALNFRLTEDCLKENLRILMILMILHAATLFLCKSVFERRSPLCFEVHIERKLDRTDTQHSLIRPTAASVKVQSLVKWDFFISISDEAF